MQFPASDQEKQLVYQTADELMRHLESAGQSATDLAGLLHENFLALDEQYRKHIFAALTKIDAEAWRTKIQKVNVRNQPERIISAPQ
jgi:HD superfamily phosphohydrolase YqeK